MTTSVRSGHGGIHFYGTGSGTSRSSTTGPYATVALTCPWCGALSAAAVLAATVDSSERPITRWARCIACGEGVFIDGADVVHPGSIAGDNVEHLPAPISHLYLEARVALGNGAPTGCEMLCRSVLGAVAKNVGWTAGGTFVQALDFIQAEGYFTTAMKPWVDRIRTHGNEVTHEAVVVSEELASDTLAFTTQLLRLVFELPATSASYAPPSA